MTAYKENGSEVTSRPISPFANPSLDWTISFLGCFFSFHTAAADAAEAEEAALAAELVAGREVEGLGLKAPEREDADEADDDDERVDLGFDFGDGGSGCVM